MLISGCNPVAAPETTEALRIEVSGYSTNPVTIDWTIHDESGVVDSVMLNHTVDDPYVIERDVDIDNFDTVSVTITDVTPPTGTPVINGLSATIDTPGTRKIIQLDESLSVSGGMIVEEGDFLQVSGAPALLFRLVEDPDPANDTQVRIYDINVTTPDNFPDPFPGAWTWDLYNSNAHSISVTITRNGTGKGTSTALIDVVSLDLGSDIW